MNIGEANATNRLVRWVLGQNVPAEEARDAAAYLADRACRALHVGLTADDVRQAWPPEAPPRRDPDPGTHTTTITTTGDHL